LGKCRNKFKDKTLHIFSQSSPFAFESATRANNAIASRCTFKEKIQMEKLEKLLKSQSLRRLPCAESHDANHVPEGIEIVLGGGIPIKPQLIEMIWKEANEKHYQSN